MSWEEIKSFVGGAAGDQFGISVAISGNYAIVGAYDNDEGGADAGKAYWYQRENDGNWKQVHTEIGEAAGDNFGYSVAISGNYAIVGAYRNDDGGSSAGKVYWYQREKDGNWKQVHTEIGETGGDNFGFSVAISGNYAIVGAYRNGDGGFLAGKVYWYQREKDGNWKQVHTEIGETEFNFFGFSVAISGNYAIVGANINSDGGSSAGKVYWYQREKDGNWKQVHTEIGETGGDQFGYSVAISGNYAIVGANSNDDGGATDAGKVYWYQREKDGNWKQVHTEIGEAPSDFFGFSVAISGNYVIVGATGNDDGGSSAGKVYWYQREKNGNWKQIYTRLGEAPSDFFGRSVSISGNYAIVGANSNDDGGATDAGKAYFYLKKY